MGLLSKVWKGIKKGAKSIVKGVKKVFKGVKNIWDKFRKSTIGKVIIVAAAIYFGGAALELWEGPSWMTAAAEGAGTTSTLGAGTTVAAPTGLVSAAGAGEGVASAMPSAAELFGTASEVASGVTPAAASIAGNAGALEGVASAMPSGTSLFGAGAGAGAGGVASTMPSAAELFGTTPTPPDPSWWQTVKDAGNNAAGWMENNKVATAAIGSAVSAASAPTYQDQADAEYNTWLKQREYERKNRNIAGVNGDGTGQPIGLGLISQQQQSDLYSPTYTNRRGG